MLLLLLVLPFLASVITATLPANARNRESTRAGLIALGGALQAAWLFPQLAGGNVIQQETAGARIFLVRAACFRERQQGLSAASAPSDVGQPTGPPDR